MNMDRTNQWLALLANLGVIAGIIFLAIEMHQNTEMMRSQTRDSITGKNMEFLLAVGADEYASNIFLRGRQDNLVEGGFDTVEEQSYLFLFQANARIWENEWYQYQRGLFDDEEFLARRQTWVRAMNAPGNRAVWENVRSTYAAGFQEQIEQILEERNAE